jgi:hypothetical protein
MIVLLIIYLVSVIGAYLTIRRIFGPNGEWEALSPGITELIVVILPLCNSLVTLYGIVSIVWDCIASLNIKIDYNKIFRIKK